MAKYVVRLRYSPEAFRGMVQDPRSRAEDLQKLVDGCGMTLILGGFCVATGEVFSIVEATPEQAGELQGQFVAPNQDEIDRMLLDE